jgi:hypothetical protein
MNGDRRSEPDARVLRRMVRELGEEPVPELPWERIEARLFAELEEGGAPAATATSLLAPEAALDAADRPSFADADDARPSAMPAAAVAPAATAEAASRTTLAPRAAKRAPFFKRYRTLAAVAALAASFGGLFLAADRGREASPVVAVAEPIDPAAVPQAPGMAPGVLDARSLSMGDVVEAAFGPLAFGSLFPTPNEPRTEETETASLSWTLAAGSRAVVREPASASVHVVELESGSLRAEASGAKRFVVRAGDTEVSSAVGGAIFSVTRSSRGLVVHVERGAVVVGERGVTADPAQKGDASSQRLLTGPVRVSIALDGSRQIDVIPDEVAAVAPPAPVDVVPEDDASRILDAAPVDDAAKPSTPVATAPVENPATPPAPGPTSNAPPAGDKAPAAPAAAGPISEAAIRSAVQRCFADVQSKRSPNEGVAVSVSSTLRVTVRADGSVQGLTFNPPLQADLQSCAVFLFRENLGAGARSLSVPVAHR